MDIQIGYADTPAEREAVYRLRYDIYAREMNLESAAVDHERQQLFDVNDETARLLTATVDGELVGTLRIHWGGDAPFPDEFDDTYDLSHFQPATTPDQIVVFSRLMVRKEFRGSMVPVQFFATIAKFAVDTRARLTFCDCQPHLLNLYTRLGYRTYTRTYDDPLMGLLVPLVLVVEDLAHLRAISSPLLAFEAGEGFEPAPPEDLLALLPATPTVQSVTRDDAAEWASSYGLLDDAHDEAGGLLAGLTDEEVAHVMDRSFLITCEKGDVVIQRRAVDRTMFIVLSGRLEIVVGDVLVAVAGPGDVIGELAFLLRAERTADVVAASDDVRILSLNEKALMGLTDAHPATAARLFANLAKTIGTKLVSRTTALSDA